MGDGRLLGKDMSGSIAIKDDSCILNKADGDKFTSGILFILDSDVLQGFRQDLFMPVNVPPELEIK